LLASHKWDNKTHEKLLKFMQTVSILLVLDPDLTSKNMEMHTMLVWLGVIPFPDGTGVNVSQNIVHPINNK